MILSPNHAESMALKLDSRAVGEAQELLPFLESASEDAHTLLNARRKEMVRSKQRIYNLRKGLGLVSCSAVKFVKAFGWNRSEGKGTVETRLAIAGSVLRRPAPPAK